MPTYKNGGTSDANLGGNRLAPNQELQTTIIYDTLPSGVTKTSDSPSHNPLVAAVNVTGNPGDADGEVTIPATVNSEPVEGIRGTLYCTAGSAEVRFNSASASPAMIVYPNAPIEIGFRQRLVSKIYVKYLESSTRVVGNLFRA